MFNDLTTNSQIEKTKDVVGGGSKTLPSNIYDFAIKLAYGGESAKGAKFVQFEFNVEGTTHFERVYVSNRKGENFYEKGGKKFYLPGFILVNELCMLATKGKGLADQKIQSKKVEQWQDGAKVLKDTPVLVDLIGKTIKGALLEYNEYKTKLIGGKYEPIDEVRKGNELRKVLSSKGFTMNELHERQKNPDQEPEFQQKWLEKFEGVLEDRTEGVTPKAVTGSSTPNKPAQADSSNSIFEDDE